MFYSQDIDTFMNGVVGCPAGFFGTNCSKQCSVNCDESNPCDRFTGRCDRGCKIGWIGLYCNESKDLGLYLTILTLKNSICCYTYVVIHY